MQPRYLTLLLCFIASLAHGVAAHALEARRIARDVYLFEGETGQATRDNRGFTSNAGFVVTPAGVLVFDALGTPELAREMLAAIATITRQPVRRVILSHYHADHSYGLQVFKAAGAEIWAQRDGQRYLASALAQQRLAERRETLAPWVDAQTQLVVADRWIDFTAEDTQPFVFGGRKFRLIQAGPAHAPEDMMLFVERGSVLFAGDVFYSGRLPFVVDANTRGWLAAIERIRRLDARVVVPGHGAPTRNAARDLRVSERYLRYLRASMGGAVDQLESFDDAYARTDWRDFAMLPTFAVANRRNAYSVYLEMQSELLDAAGGSDDQR